MLKIIEDKRPKEQRKLFQSETQSKKVLTPSKDLNIYKIGIRIFLLTSILLFLIVIEINFKSKESKINRYINQIRNPLLFLDSSLVDIKQNKIDKFENDNNLKTYKEEVLDKDILCLYLVINIILIIIKIISYNEKIKLTQLLNKRLLQNNNNRNNRIEDNNQNKRKNKILRNINHIRNNIIKN